MTSEAFEVATRDADDCPMDMSGSFHFEDMLRGCATPEPPDPSSSSSSNGGAELPSPCVPANNLFNGDAPASVLREPSPFEPCHGGLVTLEELCSPSEVAPFCAVKTELPMFEPMYPMATQDEMTMPSCDAFNPALFGWDHFPPGMHSTELGEPYSMIQYDGDARSSDSSSNRDVRRSDLSAGIAYSSSSSGDTTMLELHVDPERVLKSEEELQYKHDDERRHAAGVEAALECLQGDFDVLVDQLAV